MSREGSDDLQSTVRPRRATSSATASHWLHAIDFAAITVPAFAIFALYIYPEEAYRFSQYLAAICVAVTVGMWLLQRFKAHPDNIVFDPIVRIDRALAAWAVTFGLLLLLAFALKITDYFSRVGAVSWFCTTAILLIVGRVGFRRWAIRQVRRGHFAVRSVIIGSGEQAEKLARHFRDHGRNLIELVGVFDDSDGPTGLSKGREATHDIDAVVQLARAGLVDRAFLAIPWNDVARLQRAIVRLSEAPLRISLAPDLAGHELLDRELSPVTGLPMLLLFDRPISGYSHLAKCAEDILLSICFLVLSLPVFLIISIAIKLDSPGPVFFKQSRFGFNNKMFYVWKFRSFYQNLEDLKAIELTTRNDPRVTRIGRIIRRLSLDELPQLFNVIRGEMSLVGPRPHAVSASVKGRLYEDIIENYAARHKVKPGITGWAQVNGYRGETDTLVKIERRIEYDLYYINNWSLWLDLVILMRTIFVLSDDNVY